MLRTAPTLLAFALALHACQPSIGLELPEREGAEAMVLVVFENDEPRALLGLTRDASVPISIARDARLYLLAFDRSLEATGLRPGVMTLARSMGEGRPLPPATAWAAGSLKQGFEAWRTDPLPDEVTQLRLAELDLLECWRLEGCARLEPASCEIPCATPPPNAPMPPMPPDTSPVAVTPPASPSWDPIALDECAPGEARFFGSERCTPISASCPPPGSFAPNVPLGAIYVDPSRASDGDGSIGSPRNTLPPLSPGTVVALAAGEIDLSSQPMLTDVAIYGACVGETSIAGVTLGEDSELHDVRLPGGARIEGSNVLLERVESLGTIVIRGDAIANDLSVRSATIGVDSLGMLSVNRFYALWSSQAALVSNGSLALYGATIDGLSNAPSNRGAIVSIGPTTIRGAYLEDVERFGVLALDGEHELEDVTVRRLRAVPYHPEIENDVARGGIWFSGAGDIRRVKIETSFERGMVVGTSTTTFVSDVEISDVRQSPTPHSEGMAVSGPDVRVERIRIGETHEPGIVAFNPGNVQIFDLSGGSKPTAFFTLLAHSGARVHVERADLHASATNGIGAVDSALEIADVHLSGFESGIGIAVTASVGPASLELDRALMEDGAIGVALHSLHAELRAEIEDLVTIRKNVGVHSDGERIQLRTARTRIEDAYYGLAIRGGYPTIADARFVRGRIGITVNDDGLERESLPTVLQIERIVAQDGSETAIRLGQPEVTARIEDVSVRGAGGMVECTGALTDRRRIDLELERAAIEQAGGGIDSVGLDLQYCNVTATDLLVKDVKGVGASLMEVRFELRRFLFESNQTALRSERLNLSLTEGSFRRNGTALDLFGNVPSPDQLVGVSFVDNGADLD